MKKGKPSITPLLIVALASGLLVGGIALSKRTMKQADIPTPQASSRNDDGSDARHPSKQDESRTSSIKSNSEDIPLIEIGVGTESYTF